MLSQEEKEALLKNEIFVRNVQAFIARYPEQDKRILSMVVRRVSPGVKLFGFTSTPPAPGYRARLCFIASVMSPDFWTQIEGTWNSDYYFVIEPNAEAVAAAFQTLDLTKWILDPRFFFFLGYETLAELQPQLQRLLRQTALAGKLLLSQVITPASGEGVDEKWVLYAQEFNKSLRSLVEHVFFNFGNINDSVEGLRASFANLPKILESGGINELKDGFKDKPIVVVGAGPSLDKDIELLAKNQDKFLIIAVDAAVKPLLQSRCRVDFAVTIERYQDGMQEAFFEGLTEKDIGQCELVVFPVVHSLVLAKWPGPVRFVYRNYAWFAYFEKMWPRGILESGGSASHLATKLALHLGASHIYLVGCDMTYDKHPTEEKWRSHCVNPAFPNWADFNSEDAIRGNVPFYGFYDVEANDGSLAKTHTIYHQWAKEYSSLVVANAAEGKIISTAAAGIKTEGVSYRPLSEIVTELETLVPLEVAQGQQAVQTSKNPINNVTLLRNLKGCLSQFNKASEALKTLLETGLKAPEIYQTAWNIFYNKIAGDTFFTAFIIQNCAMEFFRAETSIYSVPEGHLDDEFWERRCKALLGLYEVLLDITSKTIEAVEGVEEERKLAS